MNASSSLQINTLWGPLEMHKYSLNKFIQHFPLWCLQGSFGFLLQLKKKSCLCRIQVRCIMYFVPKKTFNLVKFPHQKKDLYTMGEKWAQQGVTSKWRKTINGQLRFGKQSEKWRIRVYHKNCRQIGTFWSETKKVGGKKMGRWAFLDHLRGPAAGSHWCEPPWTHGARRPRSRRREEEGRGRRGGRLGEGGWQLNNRPASTIELKEEGEQPGVDLTPIKMYYSAQKTKTNKQ